MKKVQGLNRRPDSDVNLEKEGVFTGAFCINPLTREKMPIFVANFVLMEYGTGAVMAVPTHDQRDFEFAHKYDLPLRVVIQPDGEDPLTSETMKEAYEGPGKLVNSGLFTDRIMKRRKRPSPVIWKRKGRAEKKSNTGYGTGEFPDKGTGGPQFRMIYCERAA